MFHIVVVINDIALKPIINPNNVLLSSISWEDQRGLHSDTNFFHSVTQILWKLMTISLFRPAHEFLIIINYPDATSPPVQFLIQ